MRRETAEIVPKPDQTAMFRPALPSLRFGLVGLMLGLLLGTSAAIAEPADALDGAMPELDAPVLATAVSSPDAVEDAGGAAATPKDANAVSDVSPASGDPSRAALAELLLVYRPGTSSWKPETTDQALAAAVARGTNPDLEPLNPFRRRNRDLFRTERPVSIGNADMLLRLRLRATTRRAVSVELRF